MKASKLFVFLAGIIGVISFFLPLMKMHTNDFDFQISPFRMVMGVDQASQVIDGEKAKAVDADPAQKAKFQESVTESNAELNKLQSTVLGLYAPVAILLLLGLMGVASGKFGRGAGTFALLAGLAALGIGALMISAAKEKGGADAVGLALYMMLASGGIGALAGLMALVAPDRGEPA